MKILSDSSFPRIFTGIVIARSALKTPLLLTLLLMFSPYMFGQQATLLKDISPGKFLDDGRTDNNTSFLGEANLLFTHDGFTYFYETVATGTKEGGTYLWKTDGTIDGTVRIDLVSIREENNIALVGDLIFYVRPSKSYGEELWVTDGTAENKRMVKDIRAGVNGSEPNYFRSANGILYFSAVTSISPTVNRSLWRSDGTETGTVQIAGGYTQILFPISNLNGDMLFGIRNTQSTPGGTRYDLYKTDGTPGGIISVGQIVAEGVGYLRDGAVLDGEYYFSAYSTAHGHNIWKTNGTEAGTLMIKDIRSGGYYTDSPASYITEVNGKIYFIANSDPNESTSPRLWVTGGTAESTAQLNALNIYRPFTFLEASNHILYNDSEGLKKISLSDHTISLVKAGFSPNSYLTEQRSARLYHNGKVYFSGKMNATDGDEPWVSDGTEAGTFQLKNICAMAGQSGIRRTGTSSINNLYSPWCIKANGDKVLFLADDGLNGVNLWGSDGTQEGTNEVYDFKRSLFSGSPGSFTRSGGYLYFTVSNETQSGNAVNRSNQLWKTDGTEAGTVLVRDFGAASWIENLCDYKGQLYFTTDWGSTGTELWKSDGTEAGTTLVYDLNPGFSSSFPRYLVSLNGFLLFSASAPPYGEEVWKYDGTTITLLKDINTDGSSYPGTLAKVGNKAYFFAVSGSTGKELWATDGTTDGTYLVKDIVPGPLGSGYTPAQNIFGINGTVFFNYNNNSIGDELWKTDGTEGGTILVKDIFSGGSGSEIKDMAALNGQLFFSARDNTGYGLWKSDGTAEGTIKIKNGAVEGVTVADGILYFLGSDTEHGTEPWRSDGTAAGTYLLKDIYTGPGSSSSFDIPKTFNDRIVIYAESEVSGQEFWTSDGTPENTRLLADIMPGIGSGTPYFGAGFRGKYFFPAYHESAGYELTVFDNGITIPVADQNTYSGISEGTKATFLTGNDEIIAEITATNLATGDQSVAASVTIDNNNGSFNNQPYLRRHFDFEPGEPNPSASLKITLYVKQQEFNSFNNASSAKLPTGSTDPESYRSNLRIWQWHGSASNSPAMPGDYEGERIVIDPDDDQIVWNEALNAWEITFVATGFSGFFITAEGATPLPVTLLNFTAQKLENSVQLLWKTTEEANSDHFEVHHSPDGTSWNAIGSVATVGAHKTLKTYQHQHPDPKAGINYYRLKMIDLDGSFAFSNITAVDWATTKTEVTLYPNPASDQLMASISKQAESYEIIGSLGQVIRKGKFGNGIVHDIPVKGLPSGIYHLRLQVTDGSWTVRRFGVK